MAVDIKGSLTHKLGPLPAWGWGVALGGGYVAWRFITGGGSGGGGGSNAQPTGATFVDPAPGQNAQQTQGFLDSLTVWLDRLPSDIAEAVSKQQPPAIGQYSYG